MSSTTLPAQDASQTPSLPTHHQALYLSSLSQPLSIKSFPLPSADAIPLGSALVRIMHSGIVPYAREVYSDDPSRPYVFPTPMIPGGSCIATVAAVSADAVSLKPGDTVLYDIFVRGRDDPDVRVLAHAHAAGSEAGYGLMERVWRNGTYAEYALLPLENLTRVPDSILNMGYKTTDLAYLATLQIVLGGVEELDLRAGETVVIAPATGKFSGAATELALAMGARVVIAGRNEATLTAMKTKLEVDHPGKVKIAPLVGDVQKDAATIGAVDAYMDISPPQAGKTTHIKACVLSLRLNGRVCLWGGIKEDIGIPYPIVMHKALKIHGRWMYHPSSPRTLLRLVESGSLRLGKVKTIGPNGSGQGYPLAQWKEAFDVAAENGVWGSQTLISPWD